MWLLQERFYTLLVRAGSGARTRKVKWLSVFFTHSIFLNTLVHRTKLEADEAFQVEELLARCLNVVVVSLHTVCEDGMLYILAHTCSHLAHLGPFTGLY
jgi:hypothetical protein